MVTDTPMVRLGELIEECDKRNADENFGIDDVAGVDINKSFIPTVANLQSTDLSKYKIVPQQYFACNLMHIGRDVRLPIAYNKKESSEIVSPAYFIFRVKEGLENKLLSDYLSLIFSRYEFDRFCWFSTDSSIRGNLLLDRFCDIQIPLPSIEVQRELVAIYTGLQKIVADNQALIEQLEAACHGFIVDCKSKYPKVKIGEWIEEYDKKNTDNKNKKVRSVSVSKEFKETNAKVNKEELSGYKIVPPNHIAYVQTTKNEKCFANALNLSDESCVVTSVNRVITTKDHSVLSIGFIHLFFRENEFDRYAIFNSWGSAREVFSYEELCNVEIPLPPIEIQESIVNVYHCLEEAKRIVNDTRELMKDICPALVQKAAHSA